MSPRHLSILAACLILLGGTVAIAKPTSLFARQHLPPEFPVSAEPGLDREGWLRNLNLSPEQVQKVRSIRNQHKDTLAQQRKAVGQGQRQLREMMTNEATGAQIRQQYAQVKILREQLADTQFNSLLETREVLTLEQRRKFADQMQQPRGRRLKGSGGAGGQGAEGLGGRGAGGLGGRGAEGMQSMGNGARQPNEFVHPGALFDE